MSADEMTRQDELNTAATFHNVRTGGPKEKRLRRVELMGEHSYKPLHYIKVTQELDGGTALLTNEVIREYFELSVGDVGDIYTPVNFETKLQWDFALLGFYKKQHAMDAEEKLNNNTWAGVKVGAVVVKPWFVELYPKKPMFT